MPITFTDPPGPENLVNRDPLALLVAMVLDQQVPIEWAFVGPARLAERLGYWSAEQISTTDLDTLITIAAEKPAIHRYPATMAGRIHELCIHVVDRFGGDASRLWVGVEHAGTVFERLLALPGFGPEKAQITLAVLAKRFGHRPTRWQEFAGVFSDQVPRSVADIGGPDDLARLRAWRAQQKALGKTKAD